MSNQIPFVSCEPQQTSVAGSPCAPCGDCLNLLWLHRLLGVIYNHLGGYVAKSVAPILRAFGLIACVFTLGLG